MGNGNGSSVLEHHLDREDYIFAIISALAEGCDRLGLKARDFVEVRETVEALGHAQDWEFALATHDADQLQTIPLGELPAEAETVNEPVDGAPTDEQPSTDPFWDPEALAEQVEAADLQKPVS